MLGRRFIMMLTMWAMVFTFAARSHAAVEQPGAEAYRIHGLRGYYIAPDPMGGPDSVTMYVFHTITVYPPMKPFKNKKEEEFYWKTVRDVRRTLPYAKMICETIIETYEYIQTLPTEAERNAHLKQMETDVFNEYKPVLKTFTKGQAKMLVKLIQRETNQSSYDIVKAFLGSFRAGFWQAFGKLFGVSLKGKYQPEKNANDATIERICVALEQGTL